MALWCESFRRVTVSEAVGPKAVTLVLPYYENPGFFREQCERWWSIPESLRPYLSVIVVDDGSPDPLRLPARSAVPIRAFRIHDDVRWNWLAARNLGAYHAADSWLLMTDMDHVVPADTFRSLVLGAHDPSIVYGFERSEHDGRPIHPHSATFFLTRHMFWTIGGYDEALSGHYGTDGEYRRRVAQSAEIQILRDRVIRHEYVGDSSTTRYLRKQPEDGKVRRLVAARRPGWKPKILSFPYEEIGVVA